MGVAWPQRGDTSKIKVLRPKINILGPKTLNLLAIVLSAERKAAKLQTSGKGVNCSFFSHL